MQILTNMTDSQVQDRELPKHWPKTEIHRSNYWTPCLPFANVLPLKVVASGLMPNSKNFNPQSTAGPSI
jgi:hypothetical protein